MFLSVLLSQVYLARTEGSSTGSISWAIDCKDSNYVIDTVKIIASCTTYENGRVDWNLLGENEVDQSEVLPGGELVLIVFNLHSSHESSGKVTLVFCLLCIAEAFRELTG